MKHTKEEILNALQIIKDECEVSAGCRKCPLGDNDVLLGTFCRLKRSNPVDWIIKEEETVWRALGDAE